MKDCLGVNATVSTFSGIGAKPKWFRASATERWAERCFHSFRHRGPVQRRGNQWVFRRPAFLFLLGCLAGGTSTINID
jgi:hypothetical protein